MSKITVYVMIGIVSILCMSKPVRAADEAPQSGLYETFGVVFSVSDGYMRMSGPDEWWMDISDASFYDMVTGFPAEAIDLCEGMTVRAAYIPAGDGGDFLPEASGVNTAFAKEVLLNDGEAGAAAFKAVVSENIYYGCDDCTFMTEDGKYRITVTADTDITDADDSYIMPHDIHPGAAMFVWVELVTASCPGQAYPEKIVLINPGIPSYDRE